MSSATSVIRMCCYHTVFKVSYMYCLLLRLPLWNFLNVFIIFAEYSEFFLIHQWVTESTHFLNHFTFTFVDYVYIPVCLAYMTWMDTITCSQSWDKWMNRWTVFMNSITRIFCLCVLLEVLLWCSFFVLKLFIPCNLNHCFLVHAKFKLGCTPWWWHDYA